MKRAERTLVTGGGGFIGSHLVDRLVADGNEVRVLDNFATGDRGNLAEAMPEIELIEGDIQSYERVHRAVRGCDVVFHQAALPSVPRSVQDPLTSNAVNVIGTLNVLLAARDEGVRRVVFASSSSLYGENPEMPKHEEMQLRPIAPYAVAKQAAEAYCVAFNRVYELETVALRYFNIFGPRQDPMSQYSAVIPMFITAILEGKPPLIHGDGEQSRDFTYIDNAVEANVLAAMAPADACGIAYNIACGERVSLNAIVGELADIAAAEVESEHGPPRSGDVKHSLADISRAEAGLGYRPAIRLREGLERTFSFYRNEFERNRLGERVGH